MAHIDKEHIEIVRLWPTPCGCGMEAKDTTVLRYHLSDIHGLWKAEWKRFGIKGPAQEDEDVDDVASIASVEDGDQVRTHQRRKVAKTDAKFVECFPLSKSESKGLLVQGPTLPDRTRPSNRRKSDKKRATTG
jgi:hypothetical protein